MQFHDKETATFFGFPRPIAVIRKLSMKRNILPFWLLFSLTIAFVACKRKAAKWDTQVAVPLFNANLSLDNIDNSRLINNVSDSSYDLIYDELIYSARLAQMKTPDTSINTGFTLSRLKLSDRSISQNITLGQINPLFNFLNGQTADVPAQDQSNLSPVDIDASAFFETATLDSGFLDVTLKNELPVNVSLLVFQIINANDLSEVALDSFTNIGVGNQVTRTINLRNKTVNKSLKGVIKRLVTQASPGPVLIQANKGVNVTLTVRNLRPRSAVAAFPDQTVVNQNEALSMDMQGAQVKFFKVKAGNLHIKLESTIQENMTMYFSVPSATYNGVPLERTVNLPGVAPGTREIHEEVIDMNGYLFDFRGKNPNVTDTVNTFHQILIVKLDSSGRKLKVTLNDSVRISYSVSELTPEYAIGYLGNSLNATGPSVSPFQLFKGIDGSLVLNKFEASVLVQNFVGAQGRLKVNHLEAENIFNGKKVVLNATPLNSDILINSPAFQRDAYTERKIILDQNNSNIKAFVEALPQQIHYDFDVETNPNGNVNNFTDFVFDNSRVDVYLRLVAPASFGINGLTLRDTQVLNMGAFQGDKRLKSATLFMDIENGYPFEIDLEIAFLNSNFQQLGVAEIENNQTIMPGKVDAQGRPQSNTKSRLTIKIPREKIDMLQNATHVVIKAKVLGDGTNKKIYNTYKLKISTNGQFEYEANL